MTIANMNSIISLLTAVGGALVIALVVLMLIYLKLKRDDKQSVKEIVKEKKGEQIKASGTTAASKEGKVKQYTICSVFDFMNFEKSSFIPYVRF